MPDAVAGSDAERAVRFSREIVDATAEFACAFKLNTAFFEQFGPAGVEALERTIRFIKDCHPRCVVIVDAKRGDIDHTNRYYASALFDTLGADVVTVHPYMGHQSLLPFLERKDKGVIVMGANSCAGVREFQDLAVGPNREALYEYVCRTVAERWNDNDNCSVTAGATEPGKLGRIRQVVGDLPILLLGLGAQGGDIAECLRVGRATADFGLIANSSRQILYSSSGPDFAESAHRAAHAFNRALTFPARTSAQL
jgi:orotidine-5'-phosphate decarboxylase